MVSVRVRSVKESFGDRRAAVRAHALLEAVQPAARDHGLEPDRAPVQR
jgi:hypothetical protein